MIHIAQAIIVEGKYDKIKLSSILDAVILVTNGFRIFHDAEKMSLIRYYAKTTGVIILTDSDTAGFKIRGFLRSICGKENIVDVYVPDLYGKEKRKDHPSKEGKLGVEGVPEEVLQKAFADAGIGAELVLQKKDPITKMDLFELGLSGRAESALRRKQLMKHLTLPEHLTTNALVTVLDALMSREELFLTCGEVFEEE